MKKVLIIGGKGMLGHKLVQVLSNRFEVWATLHGTFDDVKEFGIFERVIADVDVTNIGSVRSAIASVEPDVIINAVGVIKQLPESADVVHTLEINSIFPHKLGQVAAEMGARLILVSTDCVFNGKNGHYTEDDAANALDLYGQSKHWGEMTGGNCLTIRTSIIGRELSGAYSLVEWFLSNRGGSVKGFANAIYNGFPTIVFADIIASLIDEHPELRGLYHVSSEPINKFELLMLINKAYDADVEIVRDEEFRIDRSLDSTRFREATGFQPPSWQEMIERMAADPTPYASFRR